MECLYQGAEAILSKQGDTLIKRRIAKGYRLPLVDTALRLHRHRREVKILKELRKKGIAAPRYISDDEDICAIVMEFLPGKMLKDILTQETCLAFAEQIGMSLALLHNADIIHGDLTTSNMIVGEKFFLVDFGLSFFSKRIEDKAVDLHLLSTALQSKHPQFYPLFYQHFLSIYSRHVKEYPLIATRLKKVQERGRNKSGS